MLKEIKEGVTAREVYQRAIDIVKKEKPELEKNFVKNVGFGVSGFLSMEFDESQTISLRPVWSSVIRHTCFPSRMLST